MKRLALGWACNLNELFFRFPYEKYKSLMSKFNTKDKRRSLVKAVFREGVNVILDDIIENNSTFKIQGIGYQKGEIHFDPISDDEFRRVKAKGKFRGVDFLESNFTGYQLYLYISGKRDNFLARRKFPIYFSKFFKDKLVQHTNEGKVYC